MSAAAEAFYLDVYLTVTGGAFNVVGALRLFGWLKAARGPGFEPRGHLVVVQPSGAGGTLKAREKDIEAEQVDGLVKSLRHLGFPDRSPRVEETFDTSDVWEHVVFRVTLNDATAEVDLALLASGFEGEDAEALRDVFRNLLDAAGLRGHADWYNLTGESGE